MPKGSMIAERLSLHRLRNLMHVVLDLRKLLFHFFQLLLLLLRNRSNVEIVGNADWRLAACALNRIKLIGRTLRADFLDFEGGGFALAAFSKTKHENLRLSESGSINLHDSHSGTGIKGL